MIELRYETQQSILVGLFLEKLKYEYPRKPYSGLQLSWCWWRHLIKANGQIVDIVNRNWVGAGSCTGFYWLTLLVEDTNQKGRLTVYIHDENFIGIPVVQHFMIIDRNVYDSKYGSKLLEITKPEVC